MQVSVELMISAVDFEHGQVLYYMDDDKKIPTKILTDSDIIANLDSMVKEICNINPRFFSYKLMTVIENQDQTGIILKYSISMPLDTKLKKGQFYDRGSC